MIPYLSTIILIHITHVPQCPDRSNPFFQTHFSNEQQDLQPYPGMEQQQQAVDHQGYNLWDQLHPNAQISMEYVDHQHVQQTLLMPTESNQPMTPQDMPPSLAQGAPMQNSIHYSPHTRALAGIEWMQLHLLRWAKAVQPNCRRKTQSHAKPDEQTMGWRVSHLK
jgi:hypothetical protein